MRLAILRSAPLRIGRNKRGRAGLFLARPLSCSRASCLLFVGLAGFRFGLAPWFRLVRGRLLRFTTL